MGDPEIRSYVAHVERTHRRDHTSSRAALVPHEDQYGLITLDTLEHPEQGFRIPRGSEKGA